MLVPLPFRPDSYGPVVASMLALDAAGTRPMDVFPRNCTSEIVRDTLMKADARTLFPTARDPDSALIGLFLRFSCLTEAHDLLHHVVPTLEGAYWHGIMHRMEGDAFNAGYWFRRVPGHPVFPALQQEAAKLGYAQAATPKTTASGWDPFAFIRFCEASANRPGGADEDLAKRVQLAEWQLLFDYCAASQVAAH